MNTVSVIVSYREHYKGNISVIVQSRHNGAKFINIANDSVDIIRYGADPIITALCLIAGIRCLEFNKRLI